MKISICGDVKIDNPQGLALSDELSSILHSCDYNIINFEAPVNAGLNGIEKSGPCINQSEDTPDWLEKNGWNIFSLSNNHTMDYGDDGFYKTVASFKHSTVFGAGNWGDAYSPLYLGNDDLKIAFLALTHREFGCLHDQFSQKDRLGTAWICHPIVEEIIQETRKKCDFLFIYAHAGVEFLEQPLPEWRTLYRHFIDIGCNGVFASHPHIPMGVEYYKECPIFYSLGNFCFQMNDYSKINSYWFNSIVTILNIDDNKKLNIEDHLVKYDPTSNKILIDKSEQFLNHIIAMNKLLKDDGNYIKFIDKEVLSMLSSEMRLFSYSGLIPISDIQELPLRSRLLNKLLGRTIKRVDNTSKTHLLNNLQCESHRWLIERGLKLKFGINF